MMALIVISSMDETYSLQIRKSSSKEILMENLYLEANNLLRFN